MNGIKSHRGKYGYYGYGKYGYARYGGYHESYGDNGEEEKIEADNGKQALDATKSAAG